MTRNSIAKTPSVFFAGAHPQSHDAPQHNSANREPLVNKQTRDYTLPVIDRSHRVQKGNRKSFPTAPRSSTVHTQQPEKRPKPAPSPAARSPCNHKHTSSPTSLPCLPLSSIIGGPLHGKAIRTPIRRHQKGSLTFSGENPAHPTHPQATSKEYLLPHRLLQPPSWASRTCSWALLPRSYRVILPSPWYWACSWTSWHQAYHCPRPRRQLIVLRRSRTAFAWALNHC